MTFKELDPSVIIKNDWNPNSMAKNEYKALKNSIRTFKELKEGKRVIVRQLSNNKYQIINGEHRYRAMVELGLEKIPVFDLGQISDADSKILTLALGNRGKENFGEKLKVIQSMLDSYDLENISQVIRESNNQLTDLIGSLNKSEEDLKTKFEISTKVNHKEPKDDLNNFLEEIGVPNEETEENTRNDLPPSLEIDISRSKLIKQALVVGINRGYSNFQDTIDRACACYVREYNKINKAK